MEENRTHLKEIGAELAERVGMSKKDLNVIVDSLCLDIVAELKAGNTVFLPNIGRLTVEHKDERTARNPQNGESIQIPAHRVVKFRPALGLKRHIA